ncbi:hypothetical protein C5167_035399, partial [Papaver somniferum]
MHPKKSPAVRHHGEVADDHQHTTNIEENGLVLRPMAKESDICIPLDREKEHYQTLEAPCPSVGDVLRRMKSDAKRNDKLAKLAPICLGMAAFSIAIVTPVLVELLTKMTHLHHP